MSTPSARRRALFWLAVVMIAAGFWWVRVARQQGKVETNTAHPLQFVSSSERILMDHGAFTVMKTYSVGGKKFGIRLVCFDTDHCDIRVFDQPNRWAPKSLAEACTEAGAIAGCNGGYFTTFFAPHGLMVADGVRYEDDIVPSMGGQGGALVVRSGIARLIEDTLYKDGQDVTQFLQCCPLFVSNGIARPEKAGGARRQRTFLLTDNEKHWAIGSTESISLREMCDAVTAKGAITEFEVKMALNLDGGRSRSLWWMNRKGEHRGSPSRGAVRSYVVIVPKEQSVRGD